MSSDAGGSGISRTGGKGPRPITAARSFVNAAALPGAHSTSRGTRALVKGATGSEAAEFIAVVRASLAVRPIATPRAIPVAASNTRETNVAPSDARSERSRASTIQVG